MMVVAPSCSCRPPSLLLTLLTVVVVSCPWLSLVCAPPPPPLVVGRPGGFCRLRRASLGLSLSSWFSGPVPGLPGRGWCSLVVFVPGRCCCSHRWCRCRCSCRLWCSCCPPSSRPPWHHLEPARGFGVAVVVEVVLSPSSSLSLSRQQQWWWWW